MEAPPHVGLPDTSPSATALQRATSAAVVGALLSFAGAGAARTLEGVQIGLPSLAVLVVAAFCAALVWRSGVTGLGGFSLPVVVFAAALVVPRASPLLLFSGRPLFAFALAGLVLAIVKARVRPPKVLLLPAFLAIYGFAAFQAQTRVGPDGDEPQYLMVAQSIVQDHDLVLNQDFAEKRYETFFSRPLEPHFRIRGPEGQIYSLHAVGLPVLILPAYAAFGYPGASFFLAFVAALLIHQLRRLLCDLTGREDLSEGVAWLVGLCPPVLHFAGLIFTEIPAALFLCVGLRTAVFGRTRGSAVLSALCAAALPWLNVRYSILSLAVVGALGWRLWKDSRVWESKGRSFGSFLSPAAVLVASAIGIGLYHFELWGFFDPRRVYGRRREFSLDVLPEGLPGLFFDQEFGLFIYAPVFALALAGFVFLWKRQRSLALAGLLALCGVVATASVWPMWRGGFNPPARFLVPLVPVLACALALALDRGVKPATALLAGWSLWCGIGGALNIETVHRDRDGVSPFFRTQSGGIEWTAALPSFVLSEDRPKRVLALPWALLLSIPVAATLLPSKRSAAWSKREAALAAGALTIVAITADRLSPRVRSPERDATRLLGASSVTLPSLRWQSASEASWAMAVFYEPHRAPTGLTIAHAIRLPVGRYSLSLATADSVMAQQPTSLVLIQRFSTGRSQRVVMTGEASSLRAVFQIDVTADYDIALIGGEPASITRASLRPNVQ